MGMLFQNESRLRLLLILGLAALLRFWGLGVKQLWLDEILQLLHSRPDSLTGDTGRSRAGSGRGAAGLPHPARVASKPARAD